MDFATIFDSINRTALWNVMECDGIPEKIKRLIKEFYQRTQPVFIKKLRNKDWCPGVHQGFPSTIFNYTTDWITYITRHSKSMQIGAEQRITILNTLII